MSAELLLFILRLLGAVVLLAFLGLIAWLLYRDVNLAGRRAEMRFSAGGRLQLLNGAGAKPAASFPLTPITSIGRAATNSIVLEDDYASNEHALITRRGQHWWLEDLGSRNGTLLNDIPLESAVIMAAGDVITIGSTRLQAELK